MAATFHREGSFAMMISSLHVVVKPITLDFCFVIEKLLDKICASLPHGIIFIKDLNSFIIRLLYLNLRLIILVSLFI